MLPNHAPLVIAEQFGTLETLFPGRIDLGLGRAPGSDQATSRALRRTLDTNPDDFPQDVLELMNYFQPPSGFRGVRAVPGNDLKIPIWILGSSLFGAQVAAELGLPYAFASHFAPAMLMPALELYRERFKPSSQLERPYVMLGFNVFAADTDEEAQYLASSMQQAFVNLRTGRPSKLKPPVRDYLQQLSPAEQSILEQTLSCSAIGSPKTVQTQLQEFINRTQADELMITSQVFEHAARLKSFEIAISAKDAMRR
jgi:luciferase family oxidoreductase group 1